MPKPSLGATTPISSMKEKNAKLRDNAVTMQLTKTKMCAFFERGKCASSNCRYAHSEQELRLPPNLQKTKLCRAFLAGGCSNENCFYAHGESDLRVTEGIYKTQMCNFFERGYCKKGDRCNHAHGSVDLRPPPVAKVAATPAKTSSLGGDSTRPRRSPLPLSELLVIDSEANANLSSSYSAIPPTPTKSVTELAQLAYSPVHSSPMWTQYGMHPLSPCGPSPYMSDMMWPPRDAVDMLVQDQHLNAPMNLMYAMDVMEPQLEMFEHPMAAQTPDKAFELLGLAPSPLRPAPGLCDPPSFTPSPTGFAPMACTAPPGLGGAHNLEEPSQRAPDGKDPLMVNLSERLASLDAVVLGLGNDIAQIKSDPNKRLHRI